MRNLIKNSKLKIRLMTLIKNQIEIKFRKVKLTKLKMILITISTKILLTSQLI